ncbi:MAG: hypothetical protein IKU65_04520 [Oscillospiraceae bacterium]|nr:hypothetical protein [Oscillospiraceae bacterium]
MFTEFFLGANSAHGFHSFYNELINLKEAEKVYILKGGPGSGKSSIMRRISEAATKSGEAVEKYLCSSDPASLDAIVIPSRKVAVVDGTSPHIIEPTYPLAVEEYINLGEFADCEAIKTKKREIQSVRDDYSTYFPHIYELTASAAHLDNELFDIALGATSIDKLHKKAAGIIKREIRGKGSKSDIKHRFLSAFSREGIHSLTNVNTNNFTSFFVLEDSFGLGQFILSPILSAALAADFSCIACQNHLIPEKLDHLLIPELSLAFITTNALLPFSGKYTKKIRLDSGLDRDIMKREKERVSRLRKSRKLIFDDISSLMQKAKLVHDDLESLYNPYIDFDAIYNLADGLSEKILK